MIQLCLQVVLQGKSRNLIIRELQRTNLDVNLAVNNLLSRDDENEEDPEDSQVIVEGSRTFGRLCTCIIAP